MVRTVRVLDVPVIMCANCVDHHLHQVSKKNSLKSKRVRTIFTPEQLERLESEFERQQYMVGPERLYLAHTLQLTEAQVMLYTILLRRETRFNIC